jgi:hypothetical protein
MPCARPGSTTTSAARGSSQKRSNPVPRPASSPGSAGHRGPRRCRYASRASPASRTPPFGALHLISLEHPNLVSRFRENTGTSGRGSAEHSGLIRTPALIRTSRFSRMT